MIERAPTSAATTQPIAVVTQLSACLVVADLEATAEWYRQALGFKIFLQQDFPEYAARVAYLDTGAARIELVESHQFVSAPRPDPPAHTVAQGVSQLSFWVDNLDAIVARARQQAIPIVFGPVTVPVLGLKACFVRDNEGNLIEFIQSLSRRPDPLMEIIDD